MDQAQASARRRRRTDTLPLIAQTSAPRVVSVGLDVGLDEELKRILGASEVIALEPGTDLGEAVDAEQPDLVVLRVDDASGLSHIREMKILPETHFIPVIAVGAPSTRLEAIGAGADHWVEVPLPADELRSRAFALMRTATFARALSASRQELRLRRDWVRYLVHDLRNYLTKALGDLALATRKAASDPAAAQVFYARCEEELWRCSSLLGDLLDVDRIRKGQLNLRRSATDVIGLAARVSGMFRDAADRAEVKLVLLAHEPAVVAQLDAALVERVVANLVSNALRFAPHGTPITLQIASESGRAAIEVTNLGQSIPPEKMSEIFEPFVKADDGPHAAGAGLGLAFCRLAVDLHGGTISVSEPDGGGARFRVELPLGEAPPPTQSS